MTVVALGRPDGRERWEFEHDGRTFLALRSDGRWFVTDAACPHRRGRLADGYVRNGALVCPSHWYRFDLATGACRTTSVHRLGVYPVTETSGELSVEIPDSVRRSWSDLLRAHAQDGSSSGGRRDPVR